MVLEKIISAVINIALAVSFTIWLLISAPFNGQPSVIALYYVALTVFWLFLIIRLLFSQWQKNHAVSYKSYIGPNNTIRKKMILPTIKEIAPTAAVLLKPHYMLGLAGMLLLFIINHLVLFYPIYMERQFYFLINLIENSHISRESTLFAACLISVLALAGAVLNQSREIKQNNLAYNMQNLIIHAHSKAALDVMQILVVDGDQLFLTINKLEYVLHAKPITALRHPQQQTLLRLLLNLKLDGDIPITEFYVKRLSLYVADTVIECDNTSTKFYPLFAANNKFILDFYILCNEVLPQRLSERFIIASGIRLYYCFLLKNSVGVITELYGAALYEKETAATGELHYILNENKGNQYYYL
ncbi:MAG: hypothetical protein FWG61_09455 [Firmicutes bacterium]|nr:hypothetical protein [Bacillota bacterium]